MRILVTGGGGFIGSQAAEHFSGNNHDVVACDNLSRMLTLGKKTGSQSFNWDYLRKNCPKIELHQADIRDFETVRKIGKRTDVIIHTAGQVAVTASIQDPRTDFEVNAEGTFNLLESARMNDSALLFCSTNKVYGENVNKIPVRTEAKRYMFDHPVYENGVPEDLSIDHTGHSPYGSSKLAADIYVQDYAHTYGLRTAVFRMSCIYGERQLGVEDQGWLTWFAIATLTGAPITIYGDGKQVRDVLYVSDLVNAFDRFLQSPVEHGVFNIGGGPGNTLSLLELLDMIRELTNIEPKVRYDTWRQSDQKVYVSDIRRAQQELGWKPTIPLQEGIKRVVSWVRKNNEVFT